MSDSSTNSSPAGDVKGLEFRPMGRTEADLLLFQECFIANESPRTIELLRWQYFEPPVGRLYVDFAVASGNRPYLAAIYAVFPVAMRAEGKRVLGTQSLDTLTHKAFRGKGLFQKMASAMYERCARDGVALVYGFPNGNSAHGFFKRLEWQSLDPMPMMVKPLRLGYIVNRAMKGKLRLPRWLDLPLIRSGVRRLCAGLELRPVTDFDSATDEVWNRFSRSIPFAVDRDAAYMRWRLRRPHESYETIGLFEHGVLVGYVVTGTNSDPRPIGKIMDLVYDPGKPDARQILLREALRRLSSWGAEAVWCWNLEKSPNHGVFRRSGFFRVPTLIASDELHAGARSFGVPPLAGISDRDNWYVSLLDNDTA